jgi:hypothetical protein
VNRPEDDRPDSDAEPEGAVAPGSNDASASPDDEPWPRLHRRADAGGGRPTAIAVLTLLATLLAAAALVWVAAEMHYRNCITSADLQSRGSDRNLSQLVLRRSVANCSRSPF